MTPPSVLLVEDEENLVQAIRYNLDQEGYDVLTAQDGVTGLEKAQGEAPDLVILDIMLPGMDGLEVCKAIRKDSDVPILMLTAKGEEIDRVVGLEIGADDYVTKPFSMRELMARVRALLRRPRANVASAEDDELLRSGDLEIDLAGHSVRQGVATLSLKPREYDLLALFVGNSGRAFTRDQILERLWGYDFVGDVRTVDVHVRWLREKIEEEPSKPRRIVTVRGIGYRFEG